MVVSPATDTGLPTALLMIVLGACSQSGKPGAAVVDDQDSGRVEPGPLDLGSVSPCDAPAATATWTEVGASLGLGGGAVPLGADADGGGIAVDDIDGDGRMDVVLTWATDVVELYLGTDGGFRREAISLFAPGRPVPVDMDGDGDLDLAIAGFRPVILWNDDGAFGRMGVVPATTDGLTAVLAPVDLDGDGDMDLYGGRTHYAGDVEHAADAVLWNDGLGTLEADLDAIPGAPAANRAFDVVIFDWDEDGRPDVYVVNDMGEIAEPNRLYRNEGGTLSDVSEACGCGVTMSGMSGHRGDVDGDGIADLYLTTVPRNQLLLGQADGSFVDVALAMGAGPPEGLDRMSWGGVFADLDNDGDADLLVAEGDFGGEHAQWDHAPSPAWLFEQQGGEMVDASARLTGERLGIWRGAVAVDLNEDGVLDPIFTDVGARPRVWMSDGCTGEGWLGVRAPEGARIEVDVGGTTRVGWASGQSGFAARQPTGAWFGLGAHQEVEAVRVTLPWGRGELVQEGPFAARRWLSVPDPDRR